LETIRVLVVSKVMKVSCDYEVFEWNIKVGKK